MFKNANVIASKGIKEMVLNGLNIGDYGKGQFGNKKHEHTFFELISAREVMTGQTCLELIPQSNKNHKFLGDVKK